MRSDEARATVNVPRRGERGGRRIDLGHIRRPGIARPDAYRMRGSLADDGVAANRSAGLGN